MMTKGIIKGSEFNYIIDTSYGLSSDGYIATGTESIVYKGLKISHSGDIVLSCVLKFKYKSLLIGAEGGVSRVVNVYDRFRTHDLKIFDELQDCRSVVRIFDVIEDLGDFSLTDTHVEEGRKSISINREKFFCVVEEYVDGWSLEEYCRDYYWKLTETVDVGNNLKKKISFHQFSNDKKLRMLKSYSNDYEELIRYQSDMFDFMLNLCDILEYITDQKHILHLDIKPDNIMVTRYGKELVLIDFGRSEHIDIETKSVKSNLGEADYNKEQSITRMYQYGTLGYAAPECYVNASNGSVFPFNDDNFEKGRMSIESDIFSFGATFWECLNVFELYTGNTEFAKDKSLGGSYDYYRHNIMNDDAYCDRDLSLTSAHYHEKLENIIKKCTRRREKGFLESPLYYHDYKTLHDDIINAKESAPSIMKSENIKVRNSFGVVGVMAGLFCVILLVCGFLKMTGSYFAERKMDNIIENYNPTKIEWLENAATEQMKSSIESEKQNIYNKVFEFLSKEGDTLNYSETVVLVNLLTQMNNTKFINDSVDQMLLSVDQKELSSCIENTVTGLPNCSSDGYKIAVQIYNAQKRQNLLECYNMLVDNTDNKNLNRLVSRLAQDLNHDEQINSIAEQELKSDSNYTLLTEYETDMKLSELKNTIKQTLNNISAFGNVNGVLSNESN